MKYWRFIPVLFVGLIVALSLTTPTRVKAQLTMTNVGPGGFGGGGFSPSCSQSSTFLTAATGVTLTADKTNYDTLICGLVTDGNWNFDALYIFAAPTVTNAALINLAQPGTFNATNNSATFTAYQGFTGNGSSQDIDTNLNPNSATSTNCSGGPCYVLNSGNIGVYILNASTPATGVDIGTASGGNFSKLTAYNSGNTLSDMNDAAGDLSAANSGSTQGAWNATRTGVSARAMYLNSNETALNSDTTASTALPNLTFLFLAFNGVGAFSSDQIAAGWIGKGISNVNSCKINNRINTYMATLAVPKNVYSNSAC